MKYILVHAIVAGDYYDLVARAKKIQQYIELKNGTVLSAEISQLKLNTPFQIQIVFSGNDKCSPIVVERYVHSLENVSFLKTVPLTFYSNIYENSNKIVSQYD